MLRSMTGFGAGLFETEAYRVAVEVKSVNQRYLDIDIRAPRALDPFLEAARAKVKAYVARGKLTLNVQFLDKRERARHIRLDRSLAIAYHKALNEMSDLLHLPRPDDVRSVAAYPGVLTAEEEADAAEGAEAVLLVALDEAMARLVAMREAEGAALRADFLRRVDALEAHADEAAALGPEMARRYRERLEAAMKKLLEAREIDEARIVQETAIYADKVNYTEESVRLQSHFEQFRAIVQDADAPVGRKLDFLLQEMNREVNTMASKASLARVKELAVEMKSELEKLREQVQNIE